MPLHTYTCTNISCRKCETPEDRVVKVADLDKQVCSACLIPLSREAVPGAVVRADTNFKMQAITSKGEKVPGSFTGAKRRGWLTTRRS